MKIQIVIWVTTNMQIICANVNKHFSRIKNNVNEKFFELNYFNYIEECDLNGLRSYVSICNCFSFNFEND